MCGGPQVEVKLCVEGRWLWRRFHVYSHVHRARFYLVHPCILGQGNSVNGGGQSCVSRRDGRWRRGRRRGLNVSVLLNILRVWRRLLSRARQFQRHGSRVTGRLAVFVPNHHGRALASG